MPHQKRPFEPNTRERRWTQFIVVALANGVVLEKKFRTSYYFTLDCTLIFIDFMYTSFKKTDTTVEAIFVNLSIAYSKGYIVIMKMSLFVCFVTLKVT